MCLVDAPSQSASATGLRADQSTNIRGATSTRFPGPRSAIQPLVVTWTRPFVTRHNSARAWARMRSDDGGPPEATRIRAAVRRSTSGGRSVSSSRAQSSMFFFLRIVRLGRAANPHGMPSVSRNC